MGQYSHLQFFRHTPPNAQLVAYFSSKDVDLRVDWGKLKGKEKEKEKETEALYTAT